MRLAEDLVEAVVVDGGGTLFAAGYADGWVNVEYSIDGGVTQGTWAARGTRREVCEAEEGALAAIEVLTTGELVAAVPVNGQTVIYLSRDRGETWVVAGTV